MDELLKLADAVNIARRTRPLTVLDAGTGQRLLFRPLDVAEWYEPIIEEEEAGLEADEPWPYWLVTMVGRTKGGQFFKLMISSGYVPCGPDRNPSTLPVADRLTPLGAVTLFVALGQPIPATLSPLEPLVTWPPSQTGTAAERAQAEFELELLWETVAGGIPARPPPWRSAASSTCYGWPGSVVLRPGIAALSAGRVCARTELPWLIWWSQARMA
jgi:hypothetical protein